MPNQAAAGLEQPLLQARERPALDGERQDEPAQKISQVVGDDPQEQAHLVGPEPVTGEARPVSGGFVLLDPLLRGPVLVVEADDGAVGPGLRGGYEALPRKQLSEVMLDLGDDPSRPVPGSRLIREAAIADQRGVARSAVAE